MVFSSIIGFFKVRRSGELSDEEKVKVLEKRLKELEREVEKYKKSSREVFLEILKSRRSIRKFTDANVDWKLIYSVIEAGFAAPAAGDIKNLKIIVVRKSEIKEEIARICYQQYWIAEAPYVLIILRDDIDVVELYGDSGKLFSIQNVAAAIENMLLAAHALNLGTCWVGAYNEEALKELLSVPKTLFVDAVIPIGYPAEFPKKKLPTFKNKVYFGRFRNLYKNKE